MNIKSFLLPNQPISKKAFDILSLSWIAFFLILWIFSPFPFLPKPNEIIQSLRDLWTYDNLAIELFTSMKLYLEAVAVSAMVSLGLCYTATIGLFRPPIAVIGKLRFLSMIGISIMFTMITSNGHQLKLWMLVFSISVFFVTGMADVIAAIPKEQYDLAKTLQFNDWRTLWEIVILGQIHNAFDVLRQNAAIGWMSLSFVESISRSEGGVGALLWNKQKFYQIPGIMAIQLLILGLGIVQDQGLKWLRKVCCPYADMKRG